MVDRINKAVLLICLIFSVSIGGLSLAAGEDPYPEIKMPVMPNGYQISQFVDKSKGVKSINYLIKIKYPASEVIEFYDEYYIKNGWKRFSKKNLGKRQWERFIDGTIAGNPKVRQLIALWKSPEAKVEAFLSLRYLTYEESWENELHVHCQVQPLLDTTALEEFLKMLHETNSYSGFMDLLDSYRMPDGEVDIKKAIKENPDNDQLKRYKKIVDEIHKAGVSP